MFQYWSCSSLVSKTTITVNYIVHVKKRLFDRVTELSEVQKANYYIQSLTNHWEAFWWLYQQTTALFNILFSLLKPIVPWCHTNCNLLFFNQEQTELEKIV